MHRAQAFVLAFPVDSIPLFPKSSLCAISFSVDTFGLKGYFDAKFKTGYIT
jgi:hypothetical protein